MMEVSASYFVLPTVSLWRREVVRFLRQRSRVVGALGTPVVFWLLIGSGFRRSFTPPGTSAPIDFLRYSFPGMTVLIVLFTAIFSMISIIEDRREGFLQAVLCAPIRRSAIVLGKILGSTTLALLQAALFLLAAPLAHIPLTWGSASAAFAVLTIVSVGLSGLGFLVAWPMDSTQGFHAVMNLFLMPMWMLSGAMFPASGASPWLGWIMTLNPLSYGVAALRRTLDPASAVTDPPWATLGVSISVTLAFAAITIALAVRAIEKR